MSGSALPPDVRRRLCPADKQQDFCLGYALGPGLAQKLEGSFMAGHSHRRTSGSKPKLPTEQR